VSKSVAELEQEVELLKRQLAELRARFGFADDMDDVSEADDRPDFSTLRGSLKFEGWEGMSWEDWLEMKAEWQRSFDKAINRALGPD
jgi:hypothetical protein